MKVLVRAYSVLNVGDDLYLHVLFNRYKKVDFYLSVGEAFYESYKKNISKLKNVHIIKEIQSVSQRIFNKFGIETINKNFLKDFDACINIGGSIFIENTENNSLDILHKKEVLYFYKNSKPYFILSCNFGPYSNTKYVKQKEKVFSMCYDVCFRDTYSYNKFKHIKSVRYAPDAAFTFSKKPEEKIPNTVGISIIDISNRKNIAKYNADYINTLIKIIKKHIEIGAEIYIFSFCVFEGDETAANILYSKLTENGLADRVKIVNYNGNIDAFLKKYSSMETIIASRLHSFILSFLFEQRLIPITYSYKFTRIIDDLSLIKNYFRINELSSINLDKAEYNLPTGNYKIVNIAKKADDVFYMTDKLLTQ